MGAPVHLRGEAHFEVRSGRPGIFAGGTARRYGGWGHALLIPASAFFHRRSNPLFSILSPQWSTVDFRIAYSVRHQRRTKFHTFLRTKIGTRSSAAKTTTTKKEHG